MNAAQKTGLVSSDNVAKTESEDKHVDFAMMARFTAEEKGLVTIDLKRAIV